jgi:colicin import membrane protein
MNDLNGGKRGCGIAGRGRNAVFAVAAGGAVLLGALVAQAQTGGQQSMEERLRAQLRATTTQLQQAQAELARLRSAAPAPAPAAASGDAQKVLAQVKAQLAAERARARRLEAGQAAAQETAAGQSAQLRDAAAQVQKALQAVENERRRLASEAASKDSALQRCEAKNTELYALGQEVLHAYETVDFATVLSTRQPFASKARAKYGQIAQDYGDRLYQGRFDPNAGETPPATGGATSK